MWAILDNIPNEILSLIIAKCEHHDIFFNIGRTNSQLRQLSRAKCMWINISWTEENLKKFLFHKLIAYQLLSSHTLSLNFHTLDLRNRNMFYENEEEELMTAIDGCTNLQRFTLHTYRLAKLGRIIKCLPISLQYLHISVMNNCDVKTAKYEINFPNLKELRYIHTRLTIHILQEILNNGFCLTILDLSESDFPYEEYHQDPFSNLDLGCYCPSLEHLYLRSFFKQIYPPISHDFLFQIIEGLTKLKTIDLSNNILLTHLLMDIVTNENMKEIFVTFFEQFLIDTVNCRTRLPGRLLILHNWQPKVVQSMIEDAGICIKLANQQGLPVSRLTLSTNAECFEDKMALNENITLKRST